MHAENTIVPSDIGIDLDFDIWLVSLQNDELLVLL